MPGYPTEARIFPVSTIALHQPDVMAQDQGVEPRAGAACRASGLEEGR